MGKIKNVSDEELIVAAAEAVSMADLLRRLDYAQSGGNTKTIRARLASLGINKPELFMPRGYQVKSIRSIPLEKILTAESGYTNNQRTKRLLIKAGIKSDSCEGVGCLVSNNWLGRSIVLQLDHINGNSRDNRLENLRLLCPNCHSQTETYCVGTASKADKICSCGNVKSIGAKMCRQCKDKRQCAIEYPSVDELEAMLIEHGSYASVGRLLGVSGSQVSQRINTTQRRN